VSSCAHYPQEPVAIPLILPLRCCSPLPGPLNAVPLGRVTFTDGFAGQAVCAPGPAILPARAAIH
jgi:hypothetical protein